MEVDLYGALIVEATRLGHRLFRNNVGLANYVSESGHVYKVPYGIGAKGGSDLVGFTIKKYFPLLEPGSFGMNNFDVAVFTVVEVKPPGWKPPGEGTKAYKRYESQKKFVDAVIAAGGIAGFVRSIAEYHQLIGVTNGQAQNQDGQSRTGRA